MDLIKYTGYDEVDKKLYETKDKMLRKIKVEKRFEETKQTLSLKRNHLKKLKDSLMKEEGDVVRLEKLTLSSILSSICGNKEEKLSKEKEEFYRAKVKYDEYLSIVDRLENEVNDLRNEFFRYGNLQKKYDELIEEKKRIILDSGSENSNEIFDLMEKVSKVQFKIKEIDEAIYAGEQAMLAIRDLLEVLNSAKNYGTWDMLGGGLLVTSAKHSKLDEAKEISSEARHLLDTFNTELKDVQIHIDFNLRIDSFDRFADYFFDGLFADMNVQGKINRSIDDVNYAANQIASVLGNLKNELKYDYRELDKMKEKLNNVIENIK